MCAVLARLGVLVTQEKIDTFLAETFYSGRFLGQRGFAHDFKLWLTMYMYIMNIDQEY
jgi:hypothetical protein